MIEFMLYALSPVNDFAVLPYRFPLLNQDYALGLKCLVMTVTPFVICKVRKAAEIRNRYNQVPHLTKDTTWESDITTIKHHKQRARRSAPTIGILSHELSTLPKLVRLLLRKYCKRFISI